jgi:predicted transcriptional regulator
MKRKAKKCRVHRNFKLPPDLNQLLETEAVKTMRTQTAIVEMALREWFAINR